MGFPDSISARMQPTDQTSIACEEAGIESAQLREDDMVGRTLVYCLNVNII